ncbi:TEA/ATTS domain family-domain-containing protein [Sporodiniella umbellata]|nr:TEA/ATTS domain family-domain-containing protein [Sporodiniella umbellata]
MQHLQHIKHEQASNKHKEEQQVWPQDVEAAFIEALETIPKLGRRKILVNGKPCGRNELISDFIFRKTQKIRTRKQVSSHIQVLKNTRKNDPHFMRLLTDSVDVDEGFAMIQQPVRPHQRKPKITAANSRRHISDTQKVKPTRSHQTSSDDSSDSSSPSPADFAFDMMYQDQQNSLTSMLDLKDPFFEPFFSSLDSVTEATDSNGALFDNNGLNSLFAMQDFSALSANDVLQQLFPLTTSDSSPTMIDLLEQKNSIHHFLNSQKQQKQKRAKKTGIRKPKKKNLKASISYPNLANLSLFQSPTPLTNNPFSMDSSVLESSPAVWVDPSLYPLWPNYLCLYLEYSLPYDPTTTIPHTLATLAEFNPSCISSVDGACVAKEKCPPLSDLTLSPALNVLSVKVQLNLNVNTSDFFFNNTSFFETKDRRTVECTTTIYSFGNVVLESKEVQQALWLNEGKYMYSFAYVNQFFDAFMKGIRSLQSWEEVDIAINNLCVVQVFEDVEQKLSQQAALPLLPEDAPTELAPNTNDILLGEMASPVIHHEAVTLPDIASPLLVMIYEFERGSGTMDISLVDSGSVLLGIASDLLQSTENHP